MVQCHLELTPVFDTVDELQKLVEGRIELTHLRRIVGWVSITAILHHGHLVSRSSHTTIMWFIVLALCIVSHLNQSSQDSEAI